MRHVLALLFAIVSIVGCDNSYEEQSEKLKSFFSNNRIGQGPDFGLYKAGLGGTEYVASVHGFWEDRVVCEKFADLLNIEEPGAYYCLPLNL